MASLARPHVFAKLRVAPQQGNIKNLARLLSVFALHPSWTRFIQSLSVQTEESAEITALLNSLERSHLTTQLVELHIIIVASDSQYGLQTPQQISMESRYEHLVNLHTLTIVGPSSALVVTIIHSTSKLRNLRLIATSTDPIHLSDLPIAKIKHLKYLELQNIGTETINRILVTNAGSLHAINLQDIQGPLQVPRSLPNLREIHVDEDCELFMASTSSITSLSIFEHHSPLEAIHEYSAACKSVKMLRVVDTPYSEAGNYRDELLIVLQARLLPNLQQVHVGCCDTLLQVLPHLPDSVTQIEVFELSFASCSSIILSTLSLLQRQSTLPFTLNIHVEEDFVHFESIHTNLAGMDIPKWFICRLLLDGLIVWTSERKTHDY